MKKMAMQGRQAHIVAAVKKELKKEGICLAPEILQEIYMESTHRWQTVCIIHSREEAKLALTAVYDSVTMSEEKRTLEIRDECLWLAYSEADLEFGVEQFWEDSCGRMYNPERCEDPEFDKDKIFVVFKEVRVNACRGFERFVRDQNLIYIYIPEGAACVDKK